MGALGKMLFCTVFVYVFVWTLATTVKDFYVIFIYSNICVRSAIIPAQNNNKIPFSQTFSAFLMGLGLVAYLFIYI
jgi:hypothetical protein